VNRFLSIAFYIISTLLDVLKFALVLQALLSWFVSPTNRFYQLLRRVTEPMIAPFRPLAMRLSSGRLPIDLAPLFAFLALLLLQYLVNIAQNILYRAMLF